MDLHGIDLNLLVAFDALMAERSVTKAGTRIGRTQPAMSAALMAGCVRPIRRPARVTLRSAISASKATSRLRSMPCKSTKWMVTHIADRFQRRDADP